MQQSSRERFGRDHTQEAVGRWRTNSGATHQDRELLRGWRGLLRWVARRDFGEVAVETPLGPVSRDEVTADDRVVIPVLGRVVRVQGRVQGPNM